MKPGKINLLLFLINAALQFSILFYFPSNRSVFGFVKHYKTEKLPSTEYPYCSGETLEAYIWYHGEIAQAYFECSEKPNAQEILESKVEAYLKTKQ